MKLPTLSVIAVAVGLSTSVALAQDTKPTPGKPGAMQPGGMEMMMDEKTMAAMQERMKTMHQQMEKIRATSDPKERQKLMQEHMRAMQDGMGMMRGMGGPMMMGMGGGQKGAMGAGQKGGMGPGMMGGDPKQRQEMMERRMDMMQMMMEQMMQHQQMMHSAPAK